MDYTPDLRKYTRPEVEQAALGCLLLERTFDYSPFDLTLDDFTVIKNREVYAYICDYFKENGSSPDTVTAASYFKAAGKNYNAALAEMIDCVPSPTLYPSYVSQLRRITIERKTAELYWHWQEGRIDFEEYQDKVRGLELSGKPLIPWKERLNEFSESISGSRPKPKAYQTCFPIFNHKTGGLFSGELVIIGGRSGRGKTGLLCNLAVGFAGEGYSVAFLSLEMSAFAILSRFFGAELSINTRTFRMADKLTPEELQEIGNKVLEWQDFKIFLEDRRIANLREVEKVIRENKPEIVIVDYIQRLFTGKSENRNLELDFIINRLKSLAVRQQCVVIAAAQLGRQAEGKENAELRDLRDSGALEQTADIVILMNPRQDKAEEALMQLDIAKSRHSGRFRTNVKFAKTFQKFEEIGEDKS